MTPREKKLAGAVVGVILLWIASQGLTKYRTELTANKATQRAAEEELAETRTNIVRGQLAQDKLDIWLDQSLPTNIDIAESLYEDWLHSELTDAGLDVEELSSKLSLQSQNNYSKQLTFTVEAKGKMPALVAFLHSFYKAGHLHRIAKANLSPAKGTDDLSVFLIVDALVLNDCIRSKELSETESPIELATRETYLQEIGGRNIFAAFKSNQPKEVISQKQDSTAAESRVSSMTLGAGGWRMTVRNQKSGKMSYFREGDAIEIGQFKGVIDKLDGRRAIVSTEDKKVQLSLGQLVDQAQPISENAG